MPNLTISFTAAQLDRIKKVLTRIDDIQFGTSEPHVPSNAEIVDWLMNCLCEKIKTYEYEKSRMSGQAQVNTDLETEGWTI